MYELDAWEWVIVLSCIALIAITFTLTVLPREPMTEAWLTDYPTTMAIGQDIDFMLHMDGDSEYEVIVFLDDSKQAALRSNNHYTLHISIPNATAGMHRVTAKINDLNYGDSHQLFFTVDVI